VQYDLNLEIEKLKDSEFKWLELMHSV
jgi:hypothetical protein